MLSRFLLLHDQSNCAARHYPYRSFLFHARAIYTACFRIAHRNDVTAASRPDGHALSFDMRGAGLDQDRDEFIALDFLGRFKLVFKERGAGRNVAARG